MTGRAAGFCAGFGTPGYMNPIAGRGFGMGLGRGRGACGGRGNGRGWRNMFHATGLTGWQRAAGWTMAGAASVSDAALTREQHLAALKARVDYLEEAGKELRQQIEELDAAKPEK
jgi:hypothetical protein